MKAPYKIYVTPVGTWDTKHIPDLQDNIYISKDALLEWLESKVYEHNEDRFDDGFNAALGQVIDKLNEIVI